MRCDRCVGGALLRDPQFSCIKKNPIIIIIIIIRIIIIIIIKIKGPGPPAGQAGSGDAPLPPPPRPGPERPEPQKKIGAIGADSRNSAIFIVDRNFPNDTFSKE